MSIGTTLTILTAGVVFYLLAILWTIVQTEVVDHGVKFWNRKRA